MLTTYRMDLYQGSYFQSKAFPISKLVNRTVDAGGNPTNNLPPYTLIYVGLARVINVLNVRTYLCVQVRARRADAAGPLLLLGLRAPQRRDRRLPPRQVSTKPLTKSIANLRPNRVEFHQSWILKAFPI